MTRPQKWERATPEIIDDLLAGFRQIEKEWDAGRPYPPPQPKPETMLQIIARLGEWNASEQAANHLYLMRLRSETVGRRDMEALEKILRQKTK